MLFFKIIYFSFRKWYNNSGGYMKIEVGNINVNYTRYGNEKGKDIVFLHGWGQNIEMMKPLGDRLQKDFHITIIDLPGFGKSDKPSIVFTIYDYMECVHTILNCLKIKTPILIGHSFGGKITLAYAGKYPCEKIITFGSPFKKEIHKLSMKTKMLKKLKKVPVLNHLEGFAKKHIGSRDYRSADPIMRDILVAHVNLDLTEDVKKITCPSLFIWGDLDTEVPYERAYELEKLVKDGGAIILEGGSHYAYLEFLDRVISILRQFL